MNYIVKNSNLCLSKIIVPIYLFCLLLVVYYFYHRGIANFPILDDTTNLNVLGVLDKSPDKWWEVITGNISGIFGRSLSMATFVCDWFLSSDHYVQFKKTNTAIHLLCGCCGFILIKKIIRHIPTIKEKATVIALLTTSLWLLAPIHVSTVLYSVQRMAQLSTLFVLLALILYIHFRDKSLRSEATRNNIFALLFSNITLAMALLSKENGVVGFGLILLIEIFIFNFKTNNKRSTIIVSYYSLCMFALTLISLNTIYSYIYGGYTTRSFTLSERLLTEIHVVFDYIKNIIAPNINTMSVFHDDFPITSNLFSNIWTPIKLFLLIMPIILLSIKKIRQNTLIKFSIFGYLFYIIAISLESTIIPLEIYYEHRNYLPSWGMFLAVSILMVFAITKTKSVFTKRTVFASIIIYGIIQTMFLFILAEKWQNEDTLIAHSYLGHPASFRINNSLMYNAIKRGDFSSVNNTYLHAKSVSPELEYSLSGNQIISYCHQHLVISDKLYNAFEHPWSKQTSGSSTTAAHFIGLLAMQGQCPELNKIRFTKILSAKVQEINYDRSLQWRLHFGAAYIYYSDKNYINAMIHLNAAWKLFPNYPDPGVFIVDIAEKSNNQVLLIETLIKLQKQTNPNDIISWEQIKPLLHKYEGKIYKNR